MKNMAHSFYELPSFIVYYIRSEPFRSVTAVAHHQRSAIIDGFDETVSWGLSRFEDPDYLDRRTVVGKNIRQEFVSRGGKPELENPFYFFLGRNARFEELDANHGYVINLCNLSPETITFTVGDSLLSFDKVYRLQAEEKYQRAMVDRLFLISEIAEAFEISQTSAEIQIEAQLGINPSASIVRTLDCTGASL